MIFRQKSNIREWRIGTKLLALTIPLLITLTLIAGWTVHKRNAVSIQDKLTQRARSLHTQIMADREYYASVIVPRVIKLGGTLGPDYRQVHGQLPLPATFVREVSELTAAAREGYAANLISPWPINKEKGLRDRFHKEAFASLQDNPTGQFFRIDTIEGKPVMRMLMADFASAQSCVDCHNSHPLSPRRDFRLNDLMGGLEIVVPMEQYLAESRQDLLLTVGGGAGLCLLLVGIVAVGTRQIITRPLANLAARMQALAHSKPHPPTSQPSEALGDEVRYLTTAYDRMQGVIAKQQEQLQAVNAQLEEQVLQLRETNEELAAFSYSVSHDLRAPLRAMDGFSRILLEEHSSDMSDDAKRHLHRVRDNAQKMDHLVQDLLALSRLGRQAITMETVEPQQVVRQVLEELQTEQDGRRVAITLNDLPTCQADPSLLKQVYMNLLTNALKFTRHCDLAQITVGYDLDGDRNVYFVKDNGVGFDATYADKVFGAFQRLHRAEDYEGTGIGLAIVKRIILRHGGQVWVASQVNKGTTVYFTLAKGQRHD